MADLKLAHIVNVMEIGESMRASYLDVALPLTCKTLRIAKATAKGVVDVDLISVKVAGEEVDPEPGFIQAPDISDYAYSYIDDLRDEEPKRKVPRVVDIMTSASAVSDAEYFIYANSDIGVMPSFYIKLLEYINNGYDAMCINRRSIPKTYKGVTITADTAELAFELDGYLHGGIDCFVFKRSSISKFEFGNVFVGFAPVGQVLKTQVEINAKRFVWEKEAKMTFHVGFDTKYRAEGLYARTSRKMCDGLYEPSFPEAYWKGKSRRARWILRKRLWKSAE